MRLTPITRLTPEQTELLETIVGPGAEEPPPPFLVWARNMELAHWVENLGRYCRNESRFPQRIRELSVLICGRHFDSQAAWNAHVQQAVQEGVPADCLERLARGEDPQFKAEDERVFHAFAHEMLYDHFVTDETYAEAIALFGEEGVLDLIGCIGSFSMSAMMLNTFQVLLRPHLPRPFADVDGFRRVDASNEEGGA
ncbi:carboxymuconolactone decarboxylase family protein [Streptomyces sp. NPDC091219]|uniref:carboxymuconolactone decarboxylase family protein n=1 Tax=Streptomyces sp. NPDC091219 TaxID=3155193 RepID=UPI00344D982E